MTVSQKTSSMVIGQRATETRSVRRPILRFTDACKRDMRRGGADVDNWKAAEYDRSAWRLLVKGVGIAVETRRRLEDEARREKRHQRYQQMAESQELPVGLHVCHFSNRDCGSRI